MKACKKTYRFGAAFFRLISVLAAFTVIFAMASCNFSADYLDEEVSANAAAVAGPGGGNGSEQVDEPESPNEDGTQQGTEAGTGNGGEEGTGTGGTEPGTETGSGGSEGTEAGNGGNGGTEAGSGGNGGTEKPPVDPNPPVISNFRWNSTGNVKTSDKAEWSPTTFQKGSRLWFGLDSTEVAESVTFILNKNGQEERKNLTPANHPGYVGLGTNNGFVWAMYPTVLDFTGNAKIKVEVHYAGGITKTTQEGSFTVIEPPAAPAVTNIRWGSSIDSVRAANKANWNKPLYRGDRLVIGVDTDVNEVVSAKFQLYRKDAEGKNPRAYYIYANHDSYKDWGKLDGNSLWFEYTNDPTNYVGEAWTSVEIKYKNGTSRWVEPKIPVNEQPPYQAGDLRRITFEQTGLHASLKPSGNIEYFEYGVWPQSLKKAGVDITNEKHPRNANWLKATDGEWYEKVRTTTYKGWTYKAADGRQIPSKNDLWFKVEPIVWQRIPGTNKLMSARGLDARWFQFNGGTPHNNTITDWGMKRISEKGYTKRVFAHNYVYSDIRAWLNGIKNQSLTDGLFYWSSGTLVPQDDKRHVNHTGKGFIDYAFTAEQRAKLDTVLVVNNDYDAHMDDTNKDWKVANADALSPNTDDKVFLWSKQEITKRAWGFKSHSDNDNMRKRQPTDYSIAKGSYVRDNNGTNITAWWLRSPNYHDAIDGWKVVQTVDEAGKAHSGDTWDWADLQHCTVVPGIQLPASMLNNAPSR